MMKCNENTFDICTYMHAHVYLYYVASSAHDVYII